ncbi:Plasmid stabilization element ParE, putative [Vibrio cholerae]|nr:Plasmid stabilization element ParE, putative [Vibrio cholerae]
MRPFQLTNKAKSDLRDIALFTSRRWGREQRNIYLKQFDDSFWLLAENPDIGKACDEIRDGYRKFPQGSHVIFYRQIGSQNIEIIRILHNSNTTTATTAAHWDWKRRALTVPLEAFVSLRAKVTQRLLIEHFNAIIPM